MSIPKTRDKSFDQELFAKDLGPDLRAFSRGFSFLKASLSCARVFPGITCLRSLECGDRTPKYRTRCILGLGISAASFSINSIGERTMWVVPWPSPGFKIFEHCWNRRFNRDHCRNSHQSHSTDEYDQDQPDSVVDATTGNGITSTYSKYAKPEEIINARQSFSGCCFLAVLSQLLLKL